MMLSGLQLPRGLVCDTDEQKREVHTAETWARPACASLSNEDKLNKELKFGEKLLKGYKGYKEKASVKTFD